MTRKSLERLWLALLVAGLVLMIPFDATITLALGVACLLAFVALGVFLMAHPASLLDDESEGPAARTTPGPPP
jgi:hypothetical protein